MSFWQFIAEQSPILIALMHNCSIGTDKLGYPYYIFLISPRKHNLWVIHFIFFLFLHVNIICGFSLEVPQVASTEYHNIIICFLFPLENIYLVLIKQTRRSNTLVLHFIYND